MHSQNRRSRRGHSQTRSHHANQRHSLIHVLNHIPQASCQIARETETAQSIQSSLSSNKSLTINNRLQLHPTITSQQRQASSRNIPSGMIQPQLKLKLSLIPLPLKVMQLTTNLTQLATVHLGLNLKLEIAVLAESLLPYATANPIQHRIHTPRLNIPVKINNILPILAARKLLTNTPISIKKLIRSSPRDLKLDTPTILFAEEPVQLSANLTLPIISRKNLNLSFLMLQSRQEPGQLLLPRKQITTDSSNTVSIKSLTLKHRTMLTTQRVKTLIQIAERMLQTRRALSLNLNLLLLKLRKTLRNILLIKLQTNFLSNRTQPALNLTMQLSSTLSSPLLLKFNLNINRLKRLLQQLNLTARLMPHLSRSRKNLNSKPRNLRNTLSTNINNTSHTHHPHTNKNRGKATIMQPSPTNNQRLIVEFNFFPLKKPHRLAPRSKLTQRQALSLPPHILSATHLRTRIRLHRNLTARQATHKRL